MSKKEYEAKPAHNPKPYQRQWAVWRGDWEVATCWSEPGAQYVADRMNEGGGRAIQAEPEEETDDEAITRLTRESLGEGIFPHIDFARRLLKWERERVAKKNVDK